MVFFTITVKIPHVDWLIAIICKGTDNKNDVRCHVHTSSTENKVNSVAAFAMLL